MDILDNTKNKNNTVVDCDEEKEDEYVNDHDAEINKYSNDENLKSFKTIQHADYGLKKMHLKRFLEHSPCKTYYER